MPRGPTHGALSVVRDLMLIRPEGAAGQGEKDVSLPWGYVLVRDRAKTTDPEGFDFLLQPGGSVTAHGDSFLIQGKRVWLAGRALGPPGAALSVEHGRGEHVNVESPLTLRISAPRKTREVEFLVVLVPVPAGEAAPEIALEGGDLRVAASRVALPAEAGRPVTGRMRCHSQVVMDTPGRPLSLRAGGLS